MERTSSEIVDELRVLAAQLANVRLMSEKADLLAHQARASLLQVESEVMDLKNVLVATMQAEALKAEQDKLAGTT